MFLCSWIPAARAREVGKLSSGENRERVDGPISLEVKYLGRAEDFRLASSRFFCTAREEKKERAREREKEREQKEEVRNNTAPAGNPNQKADLGPADASVFRTRPLWALGACQFASGINKRVSVWVTSVDAARFGERNVSLRSAAHERAPEEELRPSLSLSLSPSGIFFLPVHLPGFNAPIGARRWARGPNFVEEDGTEMRKSAHARYNYL